LVLNQKKDYRSISYEFFSRGCTDITCIDSYPGCIKFVNENVEKFQIEGLKAFVADVVKFINNTSESYDIIFAGPPYAFIKLDELPDMIFKLGLLNDHGVFILEHSPKHNFEKHPKFDFYRNYGQTNFSMFV